MPQQPNATPKAKLAAFTIIYFALPMMLTLFAGVTLFLNYSGQSAPEVDADLAQLMRYALIVLTPAGVAAGYYIYKQQLLAIDAKSTLGEKINKLQGAILIKAGCVELPGLAGTVATMLTRDNSFLLFTAVIIVVFLFWRPTPEKVAEDLQLSMMERSELEK